MAAKLTNQQFLDRSNKIHDNKYTYLSEYTNGDSKISILCPIHGIFEQKSSIHLLGKGCCKCGNIKRGNRNRSSYKEFVEKARDVHGIRYQYLDTNYIKSRIPIGIKCGVHGIFNQTPAAHLQGHGCPNCYYDDCRKSSHQFMIEANIIHNNKYVYFDDYVNCRTLIRIKCLIHGDFNQRASHHLEGRGCYKCSPQANKGKDKFIVDANLVHNGKYSYPGKYINCRTMTQIECPIHGIFNQTPRNHLQYGCQKCGCNYISKQETDWLNYLNIPQEYRQTSLKINKKLIKPDAFDPNINTIYEFYGDYWHGNPKIFQLDDINMINKKTFGELYQATLKREELIIQNGYKIVSMWESSWKDKSKS